jgi:hypothetical protein
VAVPAGRRRAGGLSRPGRCDHAVVNLSALSIRTDARMETNPIHRSLEDLAQRTTALRGFL